MNASLGQALVDLGRFVGQLSISPEEAETEARAEDFEAWQAAGSGEEGRLLLGDGHALWSLLELLRLRKEILSGLAWQEGRSDDPQDFDRRLTDAVLEANPGSAWLRIRLAVLRASQLDEDDVDVIAAMEKLRLDPEELGVLRDAAVLSEVLFHGGALPDPLPFLPEGNRELQEAGRGLHSPMDDPLRRMFSESTELSEMVGRMGIDARGCLAADTAEMFAIERQDSGDALGAEMARLAARVVAADGGSEMFLPEVDWDQLKKQLAGGDCRLLAQLAGGAELVRMIAKGLCSAESLSPWAAAWAEEAEQRYWAPFREVALRPGLAWLGDALSLAVAANTIARPDEPLPELLTRYERHLNLDQPIEEFGKTRLEILCDAVLSLDAQTFSNWVNVECGPLAVEYLLDAPTSERTANRVLGLGEKTIYARLRRICYDRCVEADAEGNFKIRILTALTSLALLDHAESGRLLKVLERTELIGLTRQQVVEAFVYCDVSVYESVGTGRLLKFLSHNETMFTERIRHFDAWTGSLMDVHCGDLRRAAGAEAAGDPDSALNLAIELLRGQTTDADLLKNYELERPDLHRLREDFYEGRAAALTERVRFRVSEMQVVKRNVGERVRYRMLQTFTSRRVYLGLIAVLILAYLGFHFYIVSQPVGGTGPGKVVVPKVVDVPTFVGDLGLVAAFPEGASESVYVSQGPVSYKQYCETMNPLAGSAESQVGRGRDRPVSFISYGEAVAYCRRLGDYLRASNPLVFAQELAGYEVRLPRRAEAERVRLGGQSGFDAEWVAEENTGPQLTAGGSLLALKPILSYGGTETTRGKPQMKTTFRIVLAPKGSSSK